MPFTIGSQASAILRNLGKFASGAAKEGPSSIGGFFSTVTRPLTWTADKVGAAALLPVRGAAWVAAKAPVMTGIGAVAAGGTMAYAALGRNNNSKAAPTEMQGLQASLATNQSTIDAVAQAQQEQAMVAAAMEQPAAPMAANDNPSNRLAVGNGAQVQGVVRRPMSLVSQQPGLA